MFTEARLDHEREQLEAKKREKDEQHLYLTAKVITDEIFSKHQGFDLASFEDKNIPATDLPTFRVLKNESYPTFKSRIASHFKIPERDFRLWVLVNRQNKTTRPDVPIHENDNTQSMYLFFRQFTSLLTSVFPLQQWKVSVIQWPLELLISNYTSTTIPIMPSSAK